MHQSLTKLIDGQETFMYHEGNGSPLVMLHGIMATNDTWYYSLNAFQNDYLTIAPDLPGLGQSGWATRLFTMADYVSWLEALRKSLRLRKMTLVGHSMGGGISLAYAIRYPQRVDRLILVDALGLSGKIPWSVTRYLIGRSHLISMAMLTGKTDPYVFRYFKDWVFVDPYASARPALQLMADSTLRRGVRALEAGTRMLLSDFLAEAKRREFLSHLNNIAVPTLILWGRHDGLLPVANAYAGERRIPGARLHIFENSAHMPMLEEPDSFNEIVRDFLNSSAPKGRKTHYAKKPR